MLTPTTRPPREFEYTFIPDDSADTQWNAFPHGIQMRMLAVWRAQGEPALIKFKIVRWHDGEHSGAAGARFQLEVLQVVGHSEVAGLLHRGSAVVSSIFGYTPYSAFRKKVLRLARSHWLRSRP